MSHQSLLASLGDDFGDEDVSNFIRGAKVRTYEAPAITAKGRLSARFVDLAVQASRAGFTPLPFDPVHASADCTHTLQTQPQALLAPPYRLQIYSKNGGAVHVCDMKIGNQGLQLSWGSQRIDDFVLEPSAAPAGLMLLDGPICTPGDRVSIDVRCDRDTLIEGTLWGLSFETVKKVHELARSTPLDCQRAITDLEAELEETHRKLIEASAAAASLAVETLSVDTLLALLKRAGPDELRRALGGELASASDIIHRIGEQLGFDQKFHCEEVLTPIELGRRAYEASRKRDHHATFDARLKAHDAEDGGNGQWSTACDES